MENYDYQEDLEYQDYLESQDIPENQLAGEQFDDMLDLYRNEY